MAKILIEESEKNIHVGLKYDFEVEHFETKEVADLIKQESFDWLLLLIHLPNEFGYKVGEIC